MTKKSNNDDGGFNPDTRLALLEHTIIDINKTMERFEKRFDRIDEKFDKIDAKFDKMHDKMDTHFRTTVFMILGLYGGIVATLVTAVGKAYHWF